MRRRRRTRGTWFPTFGTLVAGQDSVNGRQFVLSTLNDGSINTIISPITFDTPRDGDSIVAETLSDVVGSEYVLERIVGKLFAHRDTEYREDLASFVDTSPATLFGAGFFVARANDPSSGGGSTTPIGSATPTERNDNYSPLEADTVREPWIWRRTWILGSAGKYPHNVTANKQYFGAGPDSQGANGFPASTALYGSVMDGPHIDSKVKRRVRSDDRLFFAVSTIAWPINDSFDSELQHGVRGYLDFRIFASLRRARQTSAF